MCGFLLRIILNAVLLFALMSQIPGVFVDTLGGALLAVAIVGLANAAVRPVLSLASRPCSSARLSGVTLLTNILMPLMVVKALPGFQILSFTAPLAGMCLLTACSVTLSRVIHDR